jgi:hypothetical protein
MKMEKSDDVIWCDECGRGLPWKHKRQTTPRRRLVEPLRRSLHALATPLLRLAEALVVWADKPERAAYEVKKHEQDKRFLKRAIFGVDYR